MGTSYIVTEERKMPFPFIRSTESPNKVIMINRDFLETGRIEGGRRDLRAKYALMIVLTVTAQALNHALGARASQEKK